ncbi:MAG: integrase core domain-containing protein [Bdellovibrionia bacterium]
MIPVQAPNKNAQIESFFSILGLEFLSVIYFYGFEEAYEKTQHFICFYNQDRLHGALGEIPLAETSEVYKCL